MILTRSTLLSPRGLLRNTCAMVLATLLTLSATSASGGRREALSWRGCGISKKAFMAHCAEIYTESTGVEIRLTGGGATLGIQAAGEQAADFGGTCRHCLPSEGELNLEMTLVAWDALAVIVHPSNSVRGITKEQLSAVLKQEITNWKELGGADLPIVVVARKGKTSGVGRMLRLLILADPEFEFGSRALRLESSGPVEKLVERCPGAIAVTGVSSSRLRSVQHLELDGHAPTAEQIATGRYPYFRPLYLAHQPNLSPAAQEFRNWLIGERGQQAVANQGTVNLEVGLLLMKRYAHFEAAERITNYEDLMRRAAMRSRAERGTSR